MAEPKTRMKPKGDFQNGASDTSRIGTITQWLDDKGYGWIDSGGKRVFAHIKDFDHGQLRPIAGDEVTFTPGTDDQGRARATEIRLARQTARIGTGAWALLVLLLAPPIAGGIHDGLPWWLIPAW